MTGSDECPRCGASAGDANPHLRRARALIAELRRARALIAELQRQHDARVALDRESRDQREALLAALLDAAARKRI